VLAWAWVGCSVEKHYGLLSFFFDGVPDPTLVASGADAVRLAKETGGVFYTHLPYQQEQCNECHLDRSGTFVTSLGGDVCLKCHAGVMDEHRLMHGPVAAAACLYCHAPHESTVKPLLRANGPQVCTQCHEPNLLGTPRSPVHADMTRNCLDCHAGHGGSTRYFLVAPVIGTDEPSADSPGQER
jgi:predicted CXXCH cytochrome family protein